jgi:prephenate dehydrogenase
MWNTTNGLGKQVVWYSEEEYQAIKKLNEANKGLLTATAKQNYKLLQEYDKLKTALAEIKEIVENGKRFAERYMITGEQKANVLAYTNAILQKISEVEND